MHSNSSNNINKSIQMEGAFHTENHINLVLSGCQDKYKMVAVPMLPTDPVQAQGNGKQ